MEESEPLHTEKENTGTYTKVFAIAQKLRSITKYLGILLLALTGIIGIGSIIPLKTQYSKQMDCSITIYVTNFSQFHTELIVPVQNSSYDWRSYLSSQQSFLNINQQKYLIFGWGDHDFYRTSSMDPKTLTKALFWPSNTVLHIWGSQQHPNTLPDKYEVKAIAISNTEYQNLVTFLQSSFQKSSVENLENIGPGLFRNSQFFHASGRYHLFNTCNHWTAQALKAADINTPLIPVLPAAILNLVKSDCPNI